MKNTATTMKTSAVGLAALLLSITACSDADDDTAADDAAQQDQPEPAEENDDFFDGEEQLTEDEAIARENEEQEAYNAAELETYERTAEAIDAQAPAFLDGTEVSSIRFNDDIELTEDMIADVVTTVDNQEMGIFAETRVIFAEGAFEDQMFDPDDDSPYGYQCPPPGQDDNLQLDGINERLQYLLWELNDVGPYDEPYDFDPESGREYAVPQAWTIEVDTNVCD